MKVRATMLGYYGDRRRHPGDEFEITSEKHFSKRWMELVLNDRIKVPTPKAEKAVGVDKAVI